MSALAAPVRSDPPAAVGRPRMHALDALRAAMMMLGIVLHAGMTYRATASVRVWTLSDPESAHRACDAAVEFIHAFRMPVFFLISGYFAALLFERRGPAEMLRNRMRRVLLPYLVALALLWPVNAAAFAFTRAAFVGAAAPWRDACEAAANAGLAPRANAHLWFLHYLVLFTLAGWALAMALRRCGPLVRFARRTLDLAQRRPALAMSACMVLTWLALLAIGQASIPASSRFAPRRQTFVPYFAFYLVGWCLFRSRYDLVRLSRWGWVALVSATALLVVRWLAEASGAAVAVVAAAQALTVWLFIVGLIGVCMRHLNGASPTVRYLSDASYWVYLVHLPIVAWLPGLFVGLGMPVAAKLTLVISLTFAICLLSYHVAVRRTFIGVFLNGAKR